MGQGKMALTKGSLKIRKMKFELGNNTSILQNIYYLPIQNFEKI
jgi:hypothetical protein